MWLPLGLFLFGFALALGFLAFALVGFGLLAEALCKNVGKGDWVLEDFFGCLLEGNVVSHLHGDVPWEGVPGLFDIGQALGVLPC